MAKKTNKKDISNKQKKPNIKTKGKATDIDVCIGYNLRLRRNLAGLSQGKLGDAVNITFQQIQKNENGKNRVAASRLYEFLHILECDINDFFDGYGGNYKSKEVKSLHSIPPEEEAFLMMDLFSYDAAHIAENCIDMMGETGTEDAADYWRKVYGYIKPHSLRH